MKYIRMNGGVGECIPYAQSFEELLHVDGNEQVYVLPSIPAKASLEEVVDTTMSLISMAPPYLPQSEIPWILAYMDDLVNFAKFYEKKDGEYCPYGIGKVARYVTQGIGYSGDLDYSPSFIEITRRITVVSLILEHLYGKRFHPRRPPKGQVPRPICHNI